MDDVSVVSVVAASRNVSVSRRVATTTAQNAEPQSPGYDPLLDLQSPGYDPLLNLQSPGYDPHSLLLDPVLEDPVPVPLIPTYVSDRYDPEYDQGSPKLRF